MGTSTGENEPQGGAAGIQLPSVAWEMEEGAGAGPAPAAPAGAPPVAPPAAPPGPPAVPQYGRVAPAAAVPPTPKPPATPPTAFPYLTPVSASGPAPEPTSDPAAVPDLLGPGAAGRPERRGRLKRPVLVAAATAGVVLMGLPFLITDGARDGKGGKADGLGLSQADLSLAQGPELGDLAPSPAATDPTATAAPTDPALVTEPVPGGTAAPTEGAPAGVPGAPPGTVGASAGPNTRPGTGPASGAPAPTSGGTGTTPGTPAPQQPAPQQPAPQQPAPQQPAPQPAPAAPSFSAVAGAGCSNAGAGYVQTGWWEQGSTGWTNNSAGGYAGSGCSNKYAAMPMSGAAAKDDGNSVLWTFTTAPVTSGSCKFSVFVPNNSDPKIVGGKPSYYTVQNSFTPGSGTTKAFTIDQTTTRGSWVSAGTFPLTGGRIAVMLHSRGVDWGGAGVDKAHHAASAVRADCTG